MSFLDDQATGQIGIGEKANLSTLTRRKRKRKKGQAPTGAETYSLMPQNEFSNIVSSPTDLQQVGIGNLLQAQGDSAGKVPNVFEKYDSAAPLLGTKEAVYYQPPEEEEEEEEEDLPSVEDDPMRNFSPGIPSDDDFLDPDNINYNVRDATFNAMSETGQPIGLVAAPARYDEDGNRLTGMDAIIDTLNPFNTNYSRTMPTGGASGTSLAPFEDGREAFNDQFNINFDESIGEGLADQAEANIAAEAANEAGRAEAESLGLGTEGPGGPPGGGVEAGASGISYGGMDTVDHSDDGSWGFASGGTVKAKNKNSFMSMKGK